VGVCSIRLPKVTPKERTRTIATIPEPDLLRRRVLESIHAALAIDRLPGLLLSDLLVQAAVVADSGASSDMVHSRLGRARAL
jgi:hypothetical protein